MSDVTHTAGWRYDIQHGPEGEANYAWLYDETGKMVATLQTYQAAKIVRSMNAATELFAALVALRDACIGMAPECADQVDAAITKSSGETQ